MEDLSVFSSETMSFAASWLSQKPGSPIFASSSFLRDCFAGKSKRVPDRNDPGREVFDRGGEILVGQAHRSSKLADAGDGCHGSRVLTRPVLCDVQNHRSHELHATC